jgi:hypothetical protein
MLISQRSISHCKILIFQLFDRASPGSQYYALEIASFWEDYIVVAADLESGELVKRGVAVVVAFRMQLLLILC